MRAYNLKIRTVTALDGPVWITRAVEMKCVGIGESWEAAISDINVRIRDTLKNAPAGADLFGTDAEVLEAFYRGTDNCATLTIDAKFDDIPGQEVRSSYAVA